MTDDEIEARDGVSGASITTVTSNHDRSHGQVAGGSAHGTPHKTSRGGSKGKPHHQHAHSKESDAVNVRFEALFKQFRSWYKGGLVLLQLMKDLKSK